MFIFIIMFLLAVIASVLVFPDAPDSALEEYCNLECKENKIRDYSICC